MDRVIYEDVVGESVRPTGVPFSALPVPACLRDGLIRFFGADIHLSPPQVWALEQGILDTEAHFLVCAPTNSGKTLIALLRIFYQAITNSSRSVYVVPLKALAEEKASELTSLALYVEEAGGPLLKIRVSTGDYQLSEDFLGSPPPDTGEILICTPERLEVILRNPDNQEWARAAKTYVLDEFHLLGEEGRGANMESLITRLLVHVPESSIVGLSATIGDPDRVSAWLGHTGKIVRVLNSEYRFPILKRSLIEVTDKNNFVLEQARGVCEKPDLSLLVFVYRKKDAENLCDYLKAELSADGLINYFHAGMPLSRRRSVAERFRQGEIRILIATTSLKMGINTPATQVIVRDTVFHGAGRLGMTDILQMIGRAGRGNAEGTGCVICTPSEGGSTYADEFKSGTIELLEPQLIRNHHKGWKKKAKDSDERPDPLRAALLGEIARQPQTRLEHLEDFLGHSFSAWCEGKNKYDTTADLNFLERGKLIYRVENTESTYSATKLGRTVVFSGLSPESGAMLASFIRALINLGEKSSEGQPKKSYLRRLRELDLLFMSLASLEARSHLVRSTSSKSRAQVEEYIESLGPEDKPLLNLWRSASSAEYPTRRLISSLKFGLNGGDEESEAIFYRLMATAILLYRHAKGESLQSLSNEYRVHPGALESGLKYTVTWILNCLAQICSPDKCYKLDFIAMRAYALLEDLSLGASLGKLMSIKGVGRRSVDKLVTKGYVTLDDVCQLTENEILGLGIKKDQAKRIARFLRRSNR